MNDSFIDNKIHTLTQACVCLYRQKIPCLGFSNDVMISPEGVSEDNRRGVSLLVRWLIMLGGVYSTSSAARCSATSAGGCLLLLIM